MGFLSRFFNESFDSPSPAVPSADPFRSAPARQLATHLQVDRYDTFQLTDAIRPAMDLSIKPTQGYRHDVYVDETSRSSVPVIMAAASRDTLFPLFLSLVQRLGPVVDVVLESSHQQEVTGRHIDLYREHIDLPVLTSILYEFESLLTHDGCTGIAVLNPNTPQEVQFDEHKLLIVYGSPLEPFEYTLETHGVTHVPDIRFLTEAEHVHTSSNGYFRQFDELRVALGVDSGPPSPSRDIDPFFGY